MHYLVFAILAFLFGCASTNVTHYGSQTMGPWRQTAADEWVRPITSPEGKSEVFAHVVGSHLLFRWVHACPSGSPENVSVTVWRPKQILTNSVKDCGGAPGVALVAGFNSPEFVAELPVVIKRLYDATQETEAPPVLVPLEQKKGHSLEI